MIYRYTDGDDFCGDTWHQNLEDAFAAAKEEYGLSEKDFTVVEDASRLRADPPLSR
jgi:hypothetical protein